jgi:hypothetical protein
VGFLALTALLFLIQPAARLYGRMTSGLTPWRSRKRRSFMTRLVYIRNLWTERWRSAEDWLQIFESAVFDHGFAHRGGDFDNWDLRIRGGLAGNAQVTLGVEEHGAGRQLLRWRIRPVVSWLFVLLVVSLLAVSCMAARSGGIVVALISAVAALGFVGWICRDCSLASGVALEALVQVEERSR